MNNLNITNRITENLHEETGVFRIHNMEILKYVHFLTCLSLHSEILIIRVIIIIRPRPAPLPVILPLGLVTSSTPSLISFPMHQAVPVHVKRSPVIPPAVGHSPSNPLVKIAQHNLLVLLEELASELSQNLQEGKIRRSPCWVLWVFKWVDSNQDSLSMKTCYSISVLKGIQPK